MTTYFVMLMLQENVISNEKDKGRRLFYDPISPEFVAIGTYYVQNCSKASRITQQLFIT